MLLLENNIKDSRDFVDFEESVYYFLRSALSSEETIQREPAIGKNYRFRPDFLLPEGCTKLGIKPLTIVDSVSDIRFDTVKRRLLFLNRDYTNNKQYKLLIVYKESAVVYRQQYHDEHLTVISFDELKYRLPNDYPFIEPVKHNEWKEDRKCRIVYAQNDFVSGDVTLFLGAGVSASAKLPLWDELLKRLINELKNRGISMDYTKISKDADNSNLIIARALRKAFGSDQAFEEAVRKVLYYSPSQPKELVKTLSELIDLNQNIVKVITYNFDDVLEQAMKKDYCSITDQNRIDPGLFPIYHVHGFLPESPTDNASHIVFSEEAYHDVYKHSYHWSNIEQLHALANTSCFFIGLSMKDPNVRRLLDISSERDMDVYHYAFLRRPEYKDPDMVDNLLLELRVRVIWYWSFDQLPRLLRKVFV